LNLDAALVSLHSSWLCWRTGLEKYVGTSIGFASSLRHGFVESYHKPFPPQIIQVLLSLLASLVSAGVSDPTIAWDGEQSIAGIISSSREI
jgi:hypothetical protein